MKHLRLTLPLVSTLALVACSLAACETGDSAPPIPLESAPGGSGGGPGGGGPGGGGSGPASVTLTVLHTSDLHTNIMPWDYFSATADEKRGLAKIATVVARERTECSLLVDSGDTIQGTPLGTYYALVNKEPVEHPMAVAMKLLKYDAMALGNHEFNYGTGVLNKFIGEVNFPVLGANVRKSDDGGEAYGSFIIKEVCGVKVGILGLVTPGVTTWERPENIAGLRFDSPLETAKTYVPQMREQGAEVVVVSIHSGPDRQPAGSASDPATWLTNYDTWVDRGNLPGENLVVQIGREVEGIDAILSGHTHQPIPKMMVNDVIVTQPNRWGSHLGKITLGVERPAGGAFKVASRDSTLVPVDAEVAVDPAVDAAVKAYHQKTLDYVETPIGTTSAAFPGGFAARFTDSALADLINQVQEEAAESNGHPVDLSLAAIFSDGALPQGAVKLRDAYSIYVYDNTLYVMEITGQNLRDALEKDATYFATLNASALPAAPNECKVMPTGPDYNWDIYSQIEYTIDATKEPGSRVTSLKLKGLDVTPTQKLTIAINNYRGGGGGGFDMFKEGTIVWKSADGVRDFVAEFVQKHPGLNPDEVNTCNFTLVPDLYSHFFEGSLGPAKCGAP